EGSNVWTLDSNGNPTMFVQATMPDTSKTIPDPNDKSKQIQDPSATIPAVDKDGNPVWQKDASGKEVPFTVSYDGGVTSAMVDGKEVKAFNYHNSAGSVVAPHNFSYVFIQACIAILILVGFESVTAMGEEAKNAKRDIPIAVILSLVIQGCFCYALEY